MAALFWAARDGFIVEDRKQKTDVPGAALVDLPLMVEEGENKERGDQNWMGTP